MTVYEKKGTGLAGAGAVDISGPVRELIGLLGLDYRHVGELLVQPSWVHATVLVSDEDGAHTLNEDGTPEVDDHEFQGAYVRLAPAIEVLEPEVVGGHPEIPLLADDGSLIQMITVCSSCGQMRTILFLSEDRWYCSKCRAEGAAPPKLYPVA